MRMRLYLINPSNPLINMIQSSNGRWSKYRVWKPLGLLILAGLTPDEWDITVIDENRGVPDYESMPRPDLVGITAFTSQADRAYRLAAEFRGRGVPVVMGGIHATMRPEEAGERVDCVVSGEAESVWAEVLDDARRGALRAAYTGERLGMEHVPQARHDLLSTGYHFGSIQTTRGCPYNCSFCCVPSFNGSRFRHRPIGDVVEELSSIREKYVLVVDDNIVGSRTDHIARGKDLFRAISRADLGKKWIAQATVNMADDEELLRLAADSGCAGLFIGFETPTAEGLAEINKKANLKGGRDLRASVRRMQKHGILVVGSFIIGLDVDRKGIGRQIAETALRYGLDLINVLFLTPFPGTRLWDEMETDGRISADRFPGDWQYYTLTFPVARYKNLSWDEMFDESDACARIFYSYPRILKRMARNIRERRQPFYTLVSNLSSRMYSLRHGPRKIAAAQSYRERE